MLHAKKITNILYWLLMGSMLLWFAYTKGWILTNFKSVDAQTAYQLIEEDNNVSILDVRTIAEYKEGHLRDATLIPLDTLADNLQMLQHLKKHNILVYCRSGNRSIAASRILSAHGFTPINIKGGIRQLSTSGIEIVK